MLLELKRLGLPRPKEVTPDVLWAFRLCHSVHKNKDDAYLCQIERKRKVRIHKCQYRSLETLRVVDGGTQPLNFQVRLLGPFRLKFDSPVRRCYSMSEDRGEDDEVGNAEDLK